jgi:hypothetical protein
MKMLRIPPLRNRVKIAAGEDMHEGSNKLRALLDRIATGQEQLLCPQERAALQDAHAGKYRRTPGQHMSTRRMQQAVQRQQMLDWLKALRKHLKHDPDERAYKRQQRGHGSYNPNQRTAELAVKLLEQRKHELMQEYGDDFVDYPLPSVDTLANKLKRG